jgi:hypothetical protein
MDVWIIREAFNMAISALQAQEAKHSTESSLTQKALDTISRQAAIDALCSECQGRCIPCENYPCGEVEAINALPSAHSEIEERKEESAQNVPKEDLISRKAAIDYCYQLINVEHQQGSDEMNYGQERVNQTEAILHHLEFMPSAQPEPQWIPVSERLPESKPEDLEYPTVIACCEDGEVMTACYYESTKEWGIGENYDRKINPVAWMPLPEPYRAERRTDDQSK